MKDSLTRNRLKPGRILRSSARRAKAATQILLFRGGERPLSISQVVARQAGKQPSHPCIIFEDRRWTYRELDRAIDRRAHVLWSRGIRKGDTVAVVMDNRPEFLAVAYALNRIGAVAALVNTNVRAAGLVHSLEVAHATAAVVGAEHLATYEEALSAHPRKLELFVETEPGTRAEVTEGALHLTAAAKAVSTPRVPAVSPAGADLAFLIYTSGTTGLPKASKISNARATLAGIAFGSFYLGLGKWDTFYNCLPLFHSNAFLVATGSVLWNGATLALARKFSATQFWDDVRQSGATVFNYIGEICRYLMSQPERADDREHQVRAIIGNGMRPEVWGEFVRRHQPGVVHEFYGATEGNVNMVNLTGKQGSVGRLPPILFNNAVLVRFDQKTQAPVRDKRGFCILCKRGEVGELLGEIKPDKTIHRFEGYANDAATRDKVLHNVRKRGDAYFRSGDLLRKDFWGSHYFVDRIGDTYRWKGENVSTFEVADAIQLFRGVELANVYGVHLEGADGKPGMVALVLGEGVELDPADLYHHVKEHLPAYALPAFVRVATTLAVTATFKLRKVDLVDEGFDPKKTPDPLFFRDDRAQTYAPLDEVALERILAGEIRF